MFFKKTTNTVSCRHEGRFRESLAAYFLSTPSNRQLSASERKHYQNALKKLSEIEIQTILQSTNVNRPLRYGDITALLSSTLLATKQLIQKSGTSIIFRNPSENICTAAEPRVLQVALIRLIRSFTAVNAQSTIKVGIAVREQSLIVTVHAVHRPHDPVAMKLLQEVVKLHKGCLIVSGTTVAFSLRRELPYAYGLFAVPSAEELIANPVSVVNVGLA